MRLGGDGVAVPALRPEQTIDEDKENEGKFGRRWAHGCKLEGKDLDAPVRHQRG